MRRGWKRALWALSASALWACASEATKPTPAPQAVAPAPAPTPVMGGTVGENVVTAHAKVEKIDQKTRHVTLKRADGVRRTFRVDEKVRNLPQVKKGDEVVVTYYESLAYKLLKPGEAEPGVAVAAETTRAQPGAMPAGAEAAVVSITATIIGIDRSASTVTLRGPEGNVETVKVRDPRRLEAAQVGDLVELTYTEALAVAVEKPAKQKR